jgi:hypothetical protein
MKADGRCSFGRVAKIKVVLRVTELLQCAGTVSQVIEVSRLVDHLRVVHDS